MAIARIKKIEIIGLKEDKDRLLVLLQKMAIIELVARQEPAVVQAPEPTNEIVSLAEIEEAISYLATFKGKTGFLEGMVRFKPLVYQEELKEAIAGFDYRGFLKELSLLRNHFKNLEQHRERLVQERCLLLPWRKLTISLDQSHHNTATCAVLLGLLRSSDYANLLEDCEKERLVLCCEVINSDKTNSYLVIMHLRDEFERLELLLKMHHFNFVTLSRHKGTPEERLLEVNREILVLDSQMQDTKYRIRELAGQQFKLMITYDHISNIKQRQEADKNLAKQRLSFILEGWVKERQVKLLEEAVAHKFKEIAIFISEPKEQNVPVDLENNWLIEPFEFITKIYGSPKYNEIDPTPYLAPFFFLYFGFCISDVGYGIILALLSAFVLKKFRMGPQGRRFFKLFFFCGISTIIAGALTGSWFGNLIELLADANTIFLPLKRFKDSLVMLDPMKDPTKLLAIALSFGIIQVWFGNIVAAIGNIKNKRYLDVLLDQATMLTLLFGLTGLGLIFLKLYDNRQAAVFKYAALLGALGLIFTQGRSEKGVGGKLFYGIYNLYSALSGYLSDILSYSRLWALGLVTGVMASTINLISVQFSQIFLSVIPFANKVIFIKVVVGGLVLSVIFVFGHLVSFLMNLLGAFVHPVRLQFVEFFSKFFKAGGNAFRPFRAETKYINMN